MAITLREFAAEMDKAAAEFPKKLHHVAEETAKDIRDEWRRRWRGLGHLPYLWASVTYDIFDDGNGSRAEVGPDKLLPQGPLGNLIEFGSVNNAPHPGGLPALEMADFKTDKRMEDAIVAAIEGD